VRERVCERKREREKERERRKERNRGKVGFVKVRKRRQRCQ
jgi:hypothetical protein